MIKVVPTGYGFVKASPSSRTPLTRTAEQLSAAVAVPTAATPSSGQVRRIVRSTRAGGMDVTTLAALVALVAICASFARRAFRAVASP